MWITCQLFVSVVNVILQAMNPKQSEFWNDYAIGKSAKGGNLCLGCVLFITEQTLFRPSFTFHVHSVCADKDQMLIVMLVCTYAYIVSNLIMNYSK